VPPRFLPAIARVVNLFKTCCDLNYWQRNSWTGIRECLPIERVEILARRLGFDELTDLDLELLGICVDVVVLYDIERHNNSKAS
jgi:hypothetical protein